MKDIGPQGEDTELWEDRDTGQEVVGTDIGQEDRSDIGSVVDTGPGDRGDQDIGQEGQKDIDSVGDIEQDIDPQGVQGDQDIEQDIEQDRDQLDID